MSDETLDPQLKALEASLQSLAPRAPAIDRDRLLYRAGRAAANRRAATWRAWALGSTLAAAGLALALYFRPARVVEVEVVRWLPAPVEQPASSYEQPGLIGSSAALASPHVDSGNEPYGQKQLRKLAFDYGVDALPSGSAADLDAENPRVTDETPSVGSRIWWHLAHP